MESSQKWSIPASARKMSEICLSPNSNSSKRRSPNFKQYTQVVERTSSFQIDTEKFHEDPLPSPSLKSIFDFELMATSQPDSGTLVWASDVQKGRRRRSIKEMGGEKNFRHSFSLKAPIETVIEVDRPKTTETLNLLHTVLKSHFIFFFSKVQSCKR